LNCFPLRCRNKSAILGRFHRIRVTYDYLPRQQGYACETKSFGPPQRLWTSADSGQTTNFCYCPDWFRQNQAKLRKWHAHVVRCRPMLHGRSRGAGDFFPATSFERPQIWLTNQQRAEKGEFYCETSWETFETLAACGPFCPSVISNSTLSPSCKLLYPSEEIAL